MEGARVNGAIGKSQAFLPALGLAAVILAALTAAGGAAAAQGTGQKALTIYSQATLAQFINHQDDRQRALKNSPFTGDTGKFNTSTAGNGPFPGDDTLYSFNLFTDQSLKNQIGSAVYTCHYNFAKHALCTVYYTLGKGTLLAAGPVDFTATSFTLALTGGTKTYIGANGQVVMTPVANAKNVQKLAFVLLGQ
jgi:hypothetical protein